MKRHRRSVLIQSPAKALMLAATPSKLTASSSLVCQRDNFFVGGKASTQQIGIDTERTGEVDRGLSSVGDFFHGSAGIPNFIEGGDQDPSSMGTPDYLNLCGRDVEVHGQTIRFHRQHQNNRWCRTRVEKLVRRRPWRTRPNARLWRGGQHSQPCGRLWPR